jgi:hypothetical protein
MVREVTPEFDPEILPNADWADAYEVDLMHGFANANEAGQAMIECLPAWMNPMLKLRDGLTSVVGLKGTQEIGQAARQEGGNAMSFFPVISETQDRLVLGTDDKHLDFRLVLDLTNKASGTQTVRMTTILKRHNLLGRTYLKTIMPFHRAACKGSLRNMRDSMQMAAA